MQKISLWIGALYISLRYGVKLCHLLSDSVIFGQILSHLYIAGVPLNYSTACGDPATHKSSYIICFTKELNKKKAGNADTSPAIKSMRGYITIQDLGHAIF